MDNIINTYLMSWPSEYRNYGVVSFTDRIVNVFKSSNSFMSIDLGGGVKVQSAIWAGDGVVISFIQGNKTRIRKYTSASTFITIV